jgi:hypothetical protein
MMRRPRPLIRLTAAYEALLAEAKGDLARMHFEYSCRQADRDREVDALRAELAEVRALYDQLRSVSLARAQAEAELVALHRERAIVQARAAERDPATPLN